jgi:hypothetical protein
VQAIWEPKHRRSVAFQMSARDTLRRAGLGRVTIIRHYYVAAALLTVRLPKCPVRVVTSNRVNALSRFITVS